VLPKNLGRLIDANFTGADPAVLHRTAALVGIVATVYAATATLRTYMMAWVGQRLVADIRSRVFARLLRPASGVL
jgi:ATP-binding cassette subfamily B protein